MELVWVFKLGLSFSLNFKRVNLAMNFMYSFLDIRLSRLFKGRYERARKDLTSMQTNTLRYLIGGHFEMTN